MGLIDSGLGDLFGEIIKVGGKVVDKIWMDKATAGKLELSREELRKEFELAIKQMDQNGELARVDQIFREHEAQRQFANEQFGTMQVLKEMGWVGRIIALGRAGIRWIITGGSMFFTWKIINTVLTEKAVAALFAGTLGASAATILALLITLVVGIPVFYVSGVSVEKIMKVRNKL